MHKASFYKNDIRDCKNDSKNTLNIILLGTSVSTLPSNVDVDGHILTKPNNVANHFAD